MPAKTKGLVSILKKNETLTFDLIKNLKGEEHYKDDCIDINIENIEEESETGFYKGVELSIYSQEDIEGLEKLSLDKEAWRFSLPIEKMFIRGLNEKTLKNLISSVGEKLTDLSIDISDTFNLNTDFIVKNCKDLISLTLTGSSWGEENPINITLEDINKLKLNYLKIETSTDNKSFDLSNTNILELEIDNCDMSNMKFPQSIERLKVFAQGKRLNLENLSNLKKLDLRLCPDSNFTDLQNLSTLKKLKNLEISLGGENESFKLELPIETETLILNTDGRKCDLSFLKKLKSIKKLELNTDVNNFGEPFKNINSISDLTSLEDLIINENGIGVDKFKSEFNTLTIAKLNKLKYLKLDGMLGVKDLTELKNLTSIETIEIRNSKIESLKGIESFSNLNCLIMEDCHSIFDFMPLRKLNLKIFKFSIGSYWANPAKIKKENILDFKDLKISRVTFLVDKMKFTKKDYASLSKVYELDPDGNQLDLTLLN